MFDRMISTSTAVAVVAWLGLTTSASPAAAQRAQSPQPLSGSSGLDALPLYLDPPKQGPVQPARKTAPFDMTGYWVSVITENWRYRMVTPPKGDYRALYVLNAEGRKVADSWDPSKSLPADEACKPYGAPAIMRVPGRLHITWQDDNTLKMETDAGQQVRLFHFTQSPPPAAKPSWQGYTVSSWDLVAPATTQIEVDMGRGQPSGGGSLKATTSGLRPGYLQRNGVPYSSAAVVTEYYDRHAMLDGSEWLTVTTIVSDPKYLWTEYITTSDFMREPDGAKWNPSPCDASW